MAFNLAKCNFCGICLERCPYSEFTKEQCADEMRKLIKGETTRITSECITCYACNQFCPTGANPFDLILRRIEEQRGNFGSLAYYNHVAVVDLPSVSPSEVIWGKPGKPAINGSIFADWIPHQFEGQMFEGLTFLKGGDFDAKLYWEHAGRERPFREILPKKLENIARIGVKEVICPNPDDYTAATTKAMEYDVYVPFKPIHIVEYLLGYLKEHAGQVKKLNIKAAYQLPCASRYYPWVEEWRDELLKLIGVERVQRRYDRESQICCGANFGATRGYEAFKENANRNIEDMKGAGAEALVMECPMCTSNLRDMAKEAGLEPYIISNLCRLALGEELPAGGAGLGDDREFVIKGTKIVTGIIT